MRLKCCKTRFLRFFFGTVEMLLDPFGKRKRIIFLEVFLNPIGKIETCSFETKD
jgi:hypothetical protein